MANTTGGTGGGGTGVSGGEKDRGGSTPRLSPEDDRSIVKNPNNPAHEHDRVNRERQSGGG